MASRTWWTGDSHRPDMSSSSVIKRRRRLKNKGIVRESNPGRPVLPLNQRCSKKQLNTRHNTLFLDVFYFLLLLHGIGSLPVMGATLFFAGRMSSTSPGLETRSLATPSHCRMESRRRRYLLESSLRFGFFPIQWRNDEKSRLICWAPQSLKDGKQTLKFIFIDQRWPTLFGSRSSVRTNVFSTDQDMYIKAGNCGLILSHGKSVIGEIIDLESIRGQHSCAWRAACGPPAGRCPRLLLITIAMLL